MAFVIQHLELPGPVYYAGPNSGWVTNVALAVQYAQQADAQAVIDSFRMYAAVGSAGSGLAFPGRLLNIVYYLAAGTFTYVPTPGTGMVLVECLGAGGGGGVVTTVGAGQVAVAGGGAGGGYARKMFRSDFANAIVVVGAGGAAGTLVPVEPLAGGSSTFTTVTGVPYTLTGGGGFQGVNALGQAPPMIAEGRTGGQPVSGDFWFEQGTVLPGMALDVNNGWQQAGGGNIWGGPNNWHRRFSSGTRPGVLGTPVGVGGTGALSLAGGDAIGAAGTDGCVNIWEYT